MLGPFENVPYSDFTSPDAKAAYEIAVAGVRSALGVHAPVIIGGERIDTDGAIVSVNPAKPDEVVGTAGAGLPGHADAAIEAAWAAYPKWAATPVGERSRLVFALGALMKERKFEFSAWQTFEAGKNWAEAEADVAEAIDFCTYYAHQAVRLASAVPTVEYPGEHNESHLVPMGAGVAIPPWNFPLAILVGMAIGPVAAGNTIVLKPASNTPIIGYKFMEAVEEVGFPPGVINFLPGRGGDVGDALVDHPRTRFINFTGSKEVGLRIAERSAIVHPGQRWLKRAYMEMGGKDGLIVDETADLDAAADAAVRSAFGFQGQKCSACSRLILVDEVYDRVLDSVVARTSALETGPPALNAAVGPVISSAQHRSILEEIDAGKAEGELVVGGEPIDMDGGYYIAPTVFAGVDRDARLAQHEIFGPVLSVIRAADFDDAIDIANGTEFGLTGGLFSTDPSRIEAAKRRFHVGNLYINRKITGALVGVQPFGGFNMSGSNAKAGGPDYLRLFMEMKTVAEKLPD
ncbi:MAG: L-glutamate gamma-semialdehyde dehydrogenase [Acidimicrobiia bacterium]|nr:L-glutamate gamma-semialdehyde dehydrogenase [Acidimicrobiia bacterium]